MSRAAVHRALAERYGWTPEVIGNLTPDQIDAYLSEGTRKNVSRREARSLTGKR